MKTQTKAAELDVIKLENLQLRQQLLDKDRRDFEAELRDTYGNPDEDFGIKTDGTIERVPRPPAPPAPKGKGARK